MFNKVIIAGHLCSDPYLISTSKGTSVANLMLAINSYSKYENTVFINVVCYGVLAKACVDHLKKGDPVLVEGRLTQKVSKTEVLAEKIRFLRPKSSSSEDF